MESQFRVQSRSSYTCPQACHVIIQNVQGLTGRDKLKKTIKVMIKKGIQGYCFQETWLLGTFSKTIRGHLLLHHVMATKPCHRGRASSGVAIILGPALLWAWYMAGKPPFITSAPNSDLPGRMIGVTLCFPNRSNKRADTFHKRGRGGSRSSSPRSTIRWIMRTRSCSTRNWQVSTTPFLRMPNSFPDKTSTATSESGPRCFET